MGIDPLEIRLKNGYVEATPTSTARFTAVDCAATGKGKPGDPLGQKDQHLEDSDLRPSPTKRRGKGMARCSRDVILPNSCCFIKVDQDASASVICSAPEIGVEQKTVMAQMAARRHRGSTRNGLHLDTRHDITPYNGSVGSSRNTYHMGNPFASPAGGAPEDPGRRRKDAGDRSWETGSPRGKVSTMPEKNGSTLKTVMAKKFPRGGPSCGESFRHGGVSSSGGKPGLGGMSSICWMFAPHAPRWR